MDAAEKNEFQRRREARDLQAIPSDPAAYSVTAYGWETPEEKILLHALAKTGPHHLTARGVRDLGIRPEHFNEPRHRHILAAIYRLLDAGKVPDVLQILTELVREHPHDEQGFRFALDRAMRGYASIPEAEACARVVLDQYHERSRANLVARASDQIKRHGDAPSVIRDLQAGLEALDLEHGKAADAAANSRTVTELVNEAKDRLRDLAAGIAAAQPLPTPFRDLDDLLAGGIKPGQLIILAARPGGGKTALGLVWANMIAARLLGQRALFVSAEMSRAELFGRLLSATGVVSGDQANRLAYLSADAAAEVLREGNWNRFRRDRAADNLVINDALRDVGQIRAEIERLGSGPGAEPIAAVFVDYLQLLDDPTAPAGPGAANMTTAERVGRISVSLKRLARDYDVPVVALAQLNREGSKTGRFSLHHLRDSGQIEQDADVVLFIQAAAEGEAEENRWIEVAKNRHGRTGEVGVRFEADRMTWTQLTRAADPFHAVTR
jgi:replicative DNA helicase